MSIHTFKPGDYVRCINDESNTDLITKGDVYRVKTISPNGWAICVDLTPASDYPFSHERFEAITVLGKTFEPEVWLVVGIDPLPQFFEDCEAATSYARSRCALVPNKRAYVARVHGVVVGAVSVDMAGPSFPYEEDGR
jgi:hypothetical protein